MPPHFFAKTENAANEVVWKSVRFPAGCHCPHKSFISKLVVRQHRNALFVRILALNSPNLNPLDFDERSVVERATNKSEHLNVVSLRASFEVEFANMDRHMFKSATLQNDIRTAGGTCIEWIYSVGPPHVIKNVKCNFFKRWKAKNSLWHHPATLLKKIKKVEAENDFAFSNDSKDSSTLLRSQPSTACDQLTISRYVIYYN